MYQPRSAKICLQGFANNKGAEQTAHPRSLISAFVINILESIISELATSEIIIFLLVYVDLGLALLETPRTGFVASKPIIIIITRVD